MIFLTSQDDHRRPQGLPPPPQAAQQPGLLLKLRLQQGVAHFVRRPAAGFAPGQVLLQSLPGFRAQHPLGVQGHQILGQGTVNGFHGVPSICSMIFFRAR